jgi:hypothetical protein
VIISEIGTPSTEGGLLEESGEEVSSEGLTKIPG